MDDFKKTILIQLTNGEVRAPGQVIPKSHVIGIKLKTSPKLAKGRFQGSAYGKKVLVSGDFYIFNKKNYPLFKQYGVVCMYNNGWLVPILREAKDRETETMKFNVYKPHKKTVKAGPEEIVWPVVEEVCLE